MDKRNGLQPHLDLTISMDALLLLLNFYEHAQDDRDPTLLYRDNLLAVLRGMSIESVDGKCCEKKACVYRYKNKFVNTKDARFRYLEHAMAAHQDDFVHCQYKRILNGEIPVPDEVRIDTYLLRLMLFICNKRTTCSSCMVPDCPRVGADRNIISGHFRETHTKTFFYCQLLTREYDVELIRLGIDKLSHLTDKKKRKYVYKEKGTIITEEKKDDEDNEKDNEEDNEKESRKKMCF